MDTLGLSQVESIGLLLGGLDAGQGQRHLFLAHENIPALVSTIERVTNLKPRRNKDSFADLGVIVTPVTFGRYAGLIPLLFESAGRIWLIEVAQN